MIREEMPKEVF